MTRTSLVSWTLVAFAIPLAGCTEEGVRLEGTWELDTGPMIERARTQVEAMPEEEQRKAETLIEIAERVSREMIFDSDGTVTVTTTGDNVRKELEETGEWEVLDRSGDSLLVAFSGGDDLLDENEVTLHFEGADRFYLDAQDELAWMYFDRQ